MQFASCSAIRVTVDISLACVCLCWQCYGRYSTGLGRDREREQVRQSVLAGLADNKVARPRKTTIPVVPRFGRAIAAITVQQDVCITTCRALGVWSVKVECEACWTEKL